MSEELNTPIHRTMGFRAVVTDSSVRDVGKLPTDTLLVSRGLRPANGGCAHPKRDP